MLHVEDVNCILTDWRGGSSGLYTDAVNNVRIVGAELVYFVNLLEVQVEHECQWIGVIFRFDATQSESAELSTTAENVIKGL